MEALISDNQVQPNTTKYSHSPATYCHRVAKQLIVLRQSVISPSTALHHCTMYHGLSIIVQYTMVSQQHPITAQCTMVSQQHPITVQCTMVILIPACLSQATIILAPCFLAGLYAHLYTHLYAHLYVHLYEQFCALCDVNRDNTLYRVRS